jgi:DNA-binding HxlR family transcriptional regulator
MIQGACRYTDVRGGLPGIATNLLADRMRGLEAAGIVERVEAPPPVATTLFRLTPRGEELRPVLHAIGRWGSAYLADDNPDDAFCSHWMSLPLELSLKDHAPDRPPVAIEVRSGDRPIVIETHGGAVRTRLASAARPDAVLSGPPRVVMAALTGKLTLARARARGLKFEGSMASLRRIQPAV